MATNYWGKSLSGQCHSHPGWAKTNTVEYCTDPTSARRRRSCLHCKRHKDLLISWVACERSSQKKQEVLYRFQSLRAYSLGCFLQTWTEKKREEQPLEFPCWFSLKDDYLAFCFSYCIDWIDSAVKTFTHIKPPSTCCRIEWYLCATHMAMDRHPGPQKSLRNPQGFHDPYKGT